MVSSDLSFLLCGTRVLLKTRRVSSQRKDVSSKRQKPWFQVRSMALNKKTFDSHFQPTLIRDHSHLCMIQVYFNGSQVAMYFKWCERSSFGAVVVLQIGKSKGSKGQITGKKLSINSVTYNANKNLCSKGFEADYHSKLACSFQPQSMIIINIGSKISNIQEIT